MQRKRAGKARKKVVPAKGAAVRLATRIKQQQQQLLLLLLLPVWLASLPALLCLLEAAAAG